MPNIEGFLPSSDFPEHSDARSGKIYLVGAGPGDPRLITLRGLQCLAQAQVVLYDGLANAQLLDWAKQAECICVGKHGQTPIWTQDRINAALVEYASQGKQVVRLKGGDPAVFARSAEELEVLAAANLPFEVVPGITAALAAASYVGIPITHRRHASAVAFVTGQQQSGGLPQSMNWKALAEFPGTLVFYMGVTTAQDWTQQLIESGKNPNTPAAIIRRCTWSDQRVIRTTLGQVTEQLTPPSKLRPPVITIVGEVASLGENFDWFTHQPLRGCGVLLTRPENQNAQLAQELIALGADVYEQPSILIQPPEVYSTLDTAIDLLKAGSAGGITFSSSNGVEHFFRRLHELGHDARLFAGTTIGCVGPSTADALKNWGLRADVIPEEDDTYSAQGLLAALRRHPSVQDAANAEHPSRTWIVTRTNESRPDLADGLRQIHFEIHNADTYRSVQTDALSPSVEEAIAKNRIQYCVVTSSAIAKSCARLLSAHRESLTPIALSSKVASTLAELNWPTELVAESNSISALVDTLLAAHQRPIQ